MAIDMSARIGGGDRPLTIAGPLMTASGTAGFSDELARVVDFSPLGAFVTKTATLRARQGNPTPRTVETPSGMINSIGLPNPGLAGLIRHQRRRWRELGTPVIVSVAGYSVSELAELAGLLEGVNEVAAIEANFSCPNVASGLEFATDVKLLESAITAVRENCSLPLLAKLSPNVTDMRPLAVAAQGAGANGLTIMNTVLAMSIDLARRQPLLGGRYGGLSGPAIRPIGVRFVYQVFPEVDIPIIGAGGISAGNDALEYILAGASAVQLGTVNFVNADRWSQISNAIAAYCRQANVDRLSSLVGCVHHPAAS